MLAVIVGHCRFRDRVCFASNATMAGEANVCVRTLGRSLKRLQADGEIERTESPVKRRTCAWRIPHGRRRIPKCPTTHLRAGVLKSKQPHYVRARARRQPTGRKWRLMMGDIVPLRLFDAGPPEKPDVTVGQALFGAIVEANAEAGMVIPRSVIATAAKHGTDALADGVDPEIVLVGCLVALRQGKGRVANLIIADIVYAKAGQAMTPQDYRHFLAIESRQHNPDVQRIREAMQKQIEQKQIGGKS